MGIEVSNEGFQPPRSGVMLLYGLVIFLFLLFVLRFWYLQMLSGDDFARQALANRTRQQQVYATRGIIVDAQGVLLAENRPAYCLALTREDCSDIPATLAQVSQWTDTPLPLLKAKFEQDKESVPSFAPQLLITDIPFEQVIQIEHQLYQWPGVSIVTRQRRFYPHGPLFAHILGYVAEADPAEVNKEEDITLGDRIGKLGLEQVLEKRLRGTKGNNIAEVDAHGRQLGKIQQEPPIAGENITLSLDAALQQAAVDALGTDSGCIVVMEPDTGKLRALVTQPSFDNNLFTAKLSEKDWATLRDNPDHPMQNRAIQSAYPPGSVWKLMMAGLFLESGIDPKASVTCTGGVTLGTHTFRCWKAGGHGQVNMMRSLIESCDVYYYEMAQKVGIDKIERFAKACGFGDVTGIDLPYERKGLVPGKAWKQSRPPYEDWQRGETLNVSIGQGATQVTPVQMAAFVSALLNGGKLLKPSLLEDEPPQSQAPLPDGTQQEPKLLPMTPAHRAFILEAMRITAESGTARVIKRPDAVMGGKTGTAQVVRIGERRLKKHEMAYYHRDHAWLISWGMKDGKSYVVAVMVEHGGGGSTTAGPVTAKIYNALFGPVGGAKPPESGSSAQTADAPPSTAATPAPRLSPAGAAPLPQTGTATPGQRAAEARRQP